MNTLAESRHIVGSAFDSIAETYDLSFTTSHIGRAQRDVVWRYANTIFTSGNHILEINCGTGEDALFFARQGIKVTACDASEQMIQQAQSRVSVETQDADIDFRILPTEKLSELPLDTLFDGVFSNFSGLNCVADLSSVSRHLAARLESGRPLLLCLSTRFCIWETVHYLLKGNSQKAFRRWKGVADASLGGESFPVYYPTLKYLKNSFKPYFSLRKVTGVGIGVPPSYMETWVRKHPRSFHFLEMFDDLIRRVPVVRLLGDHMLLHLERV